MGGGLYLPSGYVNMGLAFESACPFVFCLGGRGTGKTYGALTEAVNRDIRFMFMRFSQTQTDLMGKPQFSPFKKINADKGTIIEPRPISKFNAAYYNCDFDESGKVVPKGSPLGYTAALSTLSNLRGFDSSDVKAIIFDEFIPERGKGFTYEDDSFSNAYETISRNRELFGEKPLKAILMANSNDMANPIFKEFNLINKVESMMKRKQEVSILSDRGIMILILHDSPISKRKKTTALYKARGESKFSNMALGNEFAYNDFTNIGSRPIKEFNPLVTIGFLTIYRHKQQKEFYVTGHSSGTPEKYELTEKDLIAFRLKYRYLYLAYISNKMFFTDYKIFLYFTKLWR